VISLGPDLVVVNIKINIKFSVFVTLFQLVKGSFQEWLLGKTLRDLLETILF